MSAADRADPAGQGWLHFLWTSGTRIFWARSDLLLFLPCVGAKVAHFHDMTGMTMAPAAVTLSVVLVLGLGFGCCLLPRGARLLSMLAVNVLLSTLLVADAVYHRFFDDVISAPIFLQIGQAGYITESIFDLLTWSDLFFCADLPLWILLIWLRRSRVVFHKRPARVWTGIWLVYAAAIGVCASVFLGQLEEVKADNDEYFRHIYTCKYLVKDLGILPFHVYDAVVALTEHEGVIDVSDEEVDEIYRWFTERNAVEKNAPVDPRVPFGLARGKNIFVIQVESLQPDVLGMKVDGQEITPRLNRFMRESIVFDRCFDQTHMGRSSDADFCGYNSLHPVGRGSMVLRYPGTQRDALPQHLQRAGYHTFISSGMDGGFWNMNWMHRRYGFVERAYVSDYTRGDEFTLGLHDQSFFLQALKRVDQLPQPFLAHFITLTSHHPYCFIRDKEPGLRLDSLYPTQAYEYLQTMHYVDAAIGQFLDGLKVRGLYDDSVILIYGDHDGFLPPHQIALLDGPFHKPWGFKGLDRVAMMLRLPGGEVIERRQTTTGHLDIAPTLLHLSGMPREGTFFLGNNLFRDNGNAVIPFRDGSFADQRYLFTSVDGGWAGGRAFRLDTRAEVDVNLCAESFREARQRLRRSDLIIQGDLIPRLRERAAPQ